MMRRLIATAMVAGVFGGFVGACGEAEDEITGTVDCFEICNEWNDCQEDATGMDIDVTACTDSCEDRVDADETFEAQIDACEECLDDVANECTDCWANCPAFPLPLD